MKTSKLLIIFFISYLVLCTNNLFGQADWVHFDSNNKLAYKTDSKGNRVMDYSYAGYMGGGVALPNVPAKVTVNVANGDMTSTIQNAINKVAGMPIVNGYRGAVVLGPGVFNVSKTITINVSGVVVRGSGSGSGGTVINMTGTTGFRCFDMLGSGSYVTSGKVNLSDSYIPSGTRTFNVSNASGFHVGGTILISRTVTQAWITYMKMDKLVRDGQPQTWMSPGTVITTDRIITEISGNKITVDAPITDDFDSQYLGTPVGTVSNYTFSGRISQCGIEHLKIQALARNTINGDAAFEAINMDNIIDSWILDVLGQETQNSFQAGGKAKRITIEKCINNLTIQQTSPAPLVDFCFTGTQILCNKCEAHANNTWAATTMGRGTGPIVFLNFITSNDRGFEPHMRWTTGLLMDLGQFTRGEGVSVINRLTSGSGHGWATGWTVAWNCKAPSFIMTEAPGTISWVIGGTGTKKTQSGQPDGIYDHFNTIVSPNSLYLQQLLERLGQSALDNIGYGTGNKAPVVSITAPSTNTVYTVPANITINAAASDADGSVTKVDFYNGTTLLGSDNTSPYSFAWSNVAAGTYTLTAKAMDNAGAVTTSIGVTVTVKTATVNKSPSVSITSPANNASFTSPASITINATSSDADGSVAKVDFYNGTTLLGSDNSSPYSFAWSNVAAGTYTLTAKATDNEGAVTTSASVTVIVKAATNGCSGIAQYVENGGYVDGSKVQNAGGIYQCKPYPYTGWCNGAAWAYGPGTGAYWTDAWVNTGSCSAKMSSANTSSSVTTISVYPNPTTQSSLVKLNVEDITDANIVVINSLGTEMFHGKMDSNLESTIDLDGMDNGIYMIKISANGKEWHAKLVKQ